jgi:hypothetical protein
MTIKKAVPAGAPATRIINLLVKLPTVENPTMENRPMTSAQSLSASNKISLVIGIPVPTGELSR